MTEKQAIMVLEMVEAHGTLPKKAKAMAIEALRLADKMNNIVAEHCEEDCNIDKALGELNEYCTAIGDYNSYVAEVNSYLGKVLQQGEANNE